MPSARARGKILENRIADAYKEAGWKVHVAEASGRWLDDYREKPCRLCGQRPKGAYITKTHDIWGVFDILAYKNGRVLYIQVCSDSGDATRRRKKILDFWGIAKDAGLSILYQWDRSKKAWAVYLLWPTGWSPVLWQTTRELKDGLRNISRVNPEAGLPEGAS